MAMAPRQFTHSIPLSADTTTLIIVDHEEGEIEYATERNAKMDALLDKTGCAFYAVWPGMHRSDLFVVNRREALKLLARG